MGVLEHSVSFNDLREHYGGIVMKVCGLLNTVVRRRVCMSVKCRVYVILFELLEIYFYRNKLLAPVYKFGDM